MPHHSVVFLLSSKLTRSAIYLTTNWIPQNCKVRGKSQEL